MSTNVFATAKKVPVKQAATKPKEREEFQISGLAELASIDSLIKSLTAVKATYEATVKADAMQIFKAQVARTHAAPENFRGIDEGATASIEFRKRSAASGLTEEEMNFLNAFNLPIGQNVQVEECFRINPKYTNDMSLLKKVSDAIQKVKGVPEDLIEMQPKVFKNIVSEETLDVACRDVHVFENVAEVIGLLAVKPKLDETDIETIIETVRDLVE